MKIFNYLVLVICVAQPAFGLSLEEMQNMALTNRETVKRHMINLEQSKKDSRLARSGYYPSVDLNYTANALDEESTTEAKENSVLYGAVTWNLFNGFRDKYSTASADVLQEIESRRLQGLQQDIQLNVALKYVDVFERRANLRVAGDNYETLKKIYRDGQNRLEVGLIDRNQLLRFKVDLGDSVIVVKAARAGVQQSVNLLGREIGKDIRLEDLDFEEFEDIPQVGDFATNESVMLENRSELKILRKLVDSARLQVKKEQGGYYPQVNLIGSYTKYDDNWANGTGDVNREELRAQLSLSLNLYNGSATEEAVAKARLESRGLQYDLDEQTDTLLTGLKNLHLLFKVAVDNVEVALDNIVQAEENLRITQLKYDEGLQRESDLLDAITNLSRAQYNHVDVLRTVYINYFQIERMVENYSVEN